MKTKIEATIPTTQYGNLRPVFELEEGDDSEVALAELQKLWDRFGESPLKDKVSVSSRNSPSAVEIKTFTGEVILWDEARHIYTDLQGKVLLSGSRYADLHSPKFDMGMILPKTAKSWEVAEEDLRQIWKMNGDVSNYWGSCIHKALELAHRYGNVGSRIQSTKSLEDNYVHPKNHYLNKVVNSFVKEYGTGALSEVVVSDVKNGRAGTIDRLEVNHDTQTCRIGDYKTNTDMDSKKMLKYQKQLSFYAHILKAHGWTVEGIDIFHLDQEDNWVKTELEVLELE